MGGAACKNRTKDNHLIEHNKVIAQSWRSLRHGIELFSEPNDGRDRPESYRHNRQGESRFLLSRSGARFLHSPDAKVGGNNGLGVIIMILYPICL